MTCDSTCETCDTEPNNCLTCKTGLFQFESTNKCVDCKEDTKSVVDGTCQTCGSNCVRCGPKSTKTCTVCPLEHILNEQSLCIRIYNISLFSSEFKSDMELASITFSQRISAPSIDLQKDMNMTISNCRRSELLTYFKTGLPDCNLITAGWTVKNIRLDENKLAIKFEFKE